MSVCGFRGCPLPRFHISDCEVTLANKLAYWGERALSLRASMERDGLSLDEIGRIFVGAAPTIRPPPMPASGPDELEARSLSSDLKLRGGSL